MSNGSPPVPTVLSGYLVDAPPISYCMDGATHLLIWGFVPLTLRLIPRDNSVKQAMDAAVGQHVTVYGVLQKPVEPGCDAMVVHDVSSAEAAAEKLGLS